MKPTISNMTAVIAALLIVASAGTAYGKKACSNSTLQGQYGAVLTGFSGGYAFAALDTVIADGAGTLTGGGTIVVNGTATAVPISATYTVNSDCTGTATFSSGSTQALIIKNDGSEVYILRTGPTDAGTVISGTAHRLDN